MLRCPTCGFPMQQEKTPPYVCTHPHVGHYSVPSEFGLRPIPKPRDEIEEKIPEEIEEKIPEIDLLKINLDTGKVEEESMEIEQVEEKPYYPPRRFQKGAKK